jgi:ketosteroid isomerase-like protein
LSSRDETTPLVLKDANLGDGLDVGAAMSQENVDVVRGLVGSWRRDTGAVIAAFDPGIEWHTAEDEPDAGTHSGIEAVLGMLRSYYNSFDEFRSDALDFIPAGDCVVVPYKIYGKPRGGKTHVYRLRNRKIVEVREYRTKAQALEAMGLKE